MKLNMSMDAAQSLGLLYWNFIVHCVESPFVVLEGSRRES
jgi:hypothetical protein